MDSLIVPNSCHVLCRVPGESPTECELSVRKAHFCCIAVSGRRPVTKLIKMSDTCTSLTHSHFESKLWPFECCSCCCFLGLAGLLESPLPGASRTSCEGRPEGHPRPVGHLLLLLIFYILLLAPLAVTTFRIRFLHHFRFRFDTKSSCDKLQNQQEPGDGGMVGQMWQKLLHSQIKEKVNNMLIL